MIGRTVSHYEIIERVGQGGMGVVYKARDLRLKRVVALKFLPEGFDRADRARFLREAQALAQLDSHENICTVYDIDDVEVGNERKTFIAMQFIEGRSLKELLADGPLDIDTALRLTAQVGRGLAYAHGVGILHRDIKPANVIVGRDGGAKIVDFGLALIRGASPDEEETRTVLTTEGSTLGTVDYMSPEQAGALDVDHRTDIWSLGVMLYEMLTGVRPFPGASTIAVLYAIANEDPVPLERLRPGLPHNVMDSVRHALEKSPDHRYSSVNDMLGDLEATYEMTARTIAPVGAESAPSIAVLPLVDMSRDQDQAYLCEGISEEIINALNEIRGLRTVARGSSFRFSGKSYDITEVRRTLRVGSILEGSVRSSADRLRITLQLIDAVRGFQVWSKRFDRKPADLFELQDEVAGAVALEMQREMGLEERSETPRPRSHNVEAYHLYLKGRYYWNSRVPDKVQKAIEHYRAALDIDPNYALAHAGLADAYITPGYYGTRPPHVVMPMARSAAAKALALDPNLAEAHATLGMVSSLYEYDWAKGEAHFRKAIEINPGYALARTWYAGFHLVAIGRIDEAISEAREAQQLDPLTPAINTIVGACLFFGGRHEEAIIELERTVELDPGFPIGLYFLGRAYWAGGRWDEAIAAIERGRSFYDLPLMAGHLGYCYASAGRREEARALLASLEEESARTHVPAASRAPIHIGLGESSQALDWLERAFRDERSFYLIWLGADPVYDAVRSEPRFQSILKEMKLA